jgi:hypothetical protein
MSTFGMKKTLKLKAFHRQRSFRSAQVFPKILLL